MARGQCSYQQLKLRQDAIKRQHGGHQDERHQNSHPTVSGQTSEVNCQVRLEVPSQKEDTIRLLFPEIPWAVDHPGGAEILTVPVTFRSDVAPGRVQVQVWREQRVVLQSETLIWRGGEQVDLGKPVMTAIDP